MPADLTAITTALTTGFANLTAAVTAGQGATDLAPLVEQVQRVADATEASNTQIATVIGDDANGDPRVRTEPKAP